MARFTEWFNNEESLDNLFENIMEGIQTKYICEELNNFLGKLFEQDEDDDSEIQNYSPFSDSDTASEIDPEEFERRHGQRDDEEDNEEDFYQGNWWRNPEVFTARTSPRGYEYYPNMPSFREIFSDDNFKQALNQAFLYTRRSHIHFRAKEIENFKKHISEHEELKKQLKQKVADGQQITRRDTGELDFKKKEIISELKKLGYCSSQDLKLNKKNKTLEFSKRLVACIKACLSEKNETAADFTFDEEEYKKQKSDFMLMIEIAVTKKVQSMTKSLEDAGIDPRDFSEFVNNMILNYVTSRVTLKNKIRKWEEIKIGSKGFLEFITTMITRSKMGKYQSHKATQLQPKDKVNSIANSSDMKKLINSDIKSNNKELLNIYRYYHLDFDGKQKIDNYIQSELNKVSSNARSLNKLKKEFELRKSVSENLPKALEAYDSDISTIFDDRGLIGSLNYFKTFVSTGTRKVTSYEDVVGRGSSSGEDEKDDASNYRSQDMEDEYLSTFDMDSRRQEDPDGPTSNLQYSNQGNSLQNSIARALERIIKNVPPNERGSAYFSPKKNRNFSTHELQIIVFALTWGLGVKYGPDGSVNFDSSQSTITDRKTGFASARITQMLKDALGIEIPEATIKTWRFQAINKLKSNAELADLFRSMN
jgi:hypothetical protein